MTIHPHQNREPQSPDPYGVGSSECSRLLAHSRSGGERGSIIFLPPPCYREVERMRKTFMVAGIATAALVITMTGPTPERGFSPQSAEAASPALTVTVACQATPERTRVQNNRRRAVTIKSVGSIYQPFNYEPIMVNRKLAARKAITFESGR